MTHDVQPEGGSGSERGKRAIDVCRDPLGLIRTQFYRAGDNRILLSNLGFLVYHATGGASAEGYRRWALQDRDLLHVKRIAIVAAKVPHAIEENIVSGSEAADGQVVALGAALSGGDADAGNIAQRIPQRGCALVLNDVLGNDVDRLRSFRQRLGQLRQRILKIGGGYFDRGCHALDFQSGFVRAAQVIADAGAGQKFLQRGLGRIKSSHSRGPDTKHRVSRHSHV